MKSREKAGKTGKTGLKLKVICKQSLRNLWSVRG